MRLTDEQLNAVELFKRSPSLKISAFAGTGKTSTLTALAHASQGRGLYLAFNKSVAAEAAAKFPKSVDCRTTHSLAIKNIPDEFRQTEGKLFGKYNFHHIARLMEMEELAVADILLSPQSLAYLTARTVQRFCQSGDDEVGVQHVPMTGKLKKLAPRHQAEFKRYLRDLAAHLWWKMCDRRSAVPLGHDGYLKHWSLSKPRLLYDFILLDEAQDTNEAVLSVLRRQQCQLTLVGDRHQQIYEWRGAVNAMASVPTSAEAALTQSFRFGAPVAAAATSILRLLDETRTVIGDPSKRTRIASFGETRTILCRTNAGVVAVVIDALNDKRRPYVVGGVVELVNMLRDVERLKNAVPAECPDFFGFANWHEVVEFSESDEGQSLRAFVKLVLAYGEAKLIRMLNAVTKEDKDADLVVSTAHKAKGCEWDSVTLYSDFEPRIDKPADPSELNFEETRLLYVAVTRARYLLVVPPMLAARWNAESAPCTAAAHAKVAPSKSSYSPPPAPPKPALPSFAKVVKADSSLPGPNALRAQAPATGDSPSVLAALSNFLRRK